MANGWTKTAIMALAVVDALTGMARVSIPLSGDGWTCDGVAVTVPHTWNAIDGSDGLGLKNEGSAGAVSYLRKAATYRRTLPDPRPGKLYFLRCEAVSQKATVRVNGREAGRHDGAFTAFCFDVTKFLKPAGNVLEIVADNRIDKDIPPIEADFTMFGGIYRDVWMIETDELHIDPTVDGAPGVEISADADSGEVLVFVRAKGAVGWRTTCTVEGPGLSEPFVAESTRFALPAYRRWSPESPNVYRLTVTVAADGQSDAVSMPFGFRTIEFRKDGFYLNGVRRQMQGVNYHQDREGKGWAITKDDIREDIAIIRDLGCDAIRTAHYPHSDYCYDRCDVEGLLAWVEAPNVNRIRFTEGYRRNAQTLIREMIAQLKHHPSVFTWSTSNEINFRASEKEGGVAEPGRSAAFMCELKKLANVCDSSRPDSTATFREYQVEENRVPTLIGFNIYPGWYRDTPDGVPSTLDRIFAANPFFTTIAVSEYGAGASVFHHAELLARGGSSEGKPGPANWHPEEYQSWVHYRNYRSLVADKRIWGTFVWIMFDFAADVVNEGCPFGQNDKGLMAYDHRTKKDAYWFYRANWRQDEPLLHLVGKRLRGLYGEKASILGFSTVGDVTLKLNGKVIGTQVPDAVKAVFWRDVPLVSGENVIELIAGDRSEKTVWKLY